jgi:hypothetical protein
VVIPAGEREVQVEFATEYVRTPIVTASVALDFNEDTATEEERAAFSELEETVLSGDLTHIVSRRNARSFTIRLNKEAPVELTFNWVALLAQAAGESTEAAD